MERYFFASSVISDIKWIQITSAEKYKSSGGVWLWRKRSLGLRWDVLLRKLKKNCSWGEHFQVDPYVMQLFKILSKARQECNLLNIHSGGRSSLQQAKRKILWKRWQKIRTNPEVSNHLTSFSGLKIPHKLSWFKYMCGYVLLSRSAFTQFLSIRMFAEG